jgi:predicted permease
VTRARTFRGWVVRLLGQLRGRRIDARIDEELRFHVEMQARDLEVSGMERQEARRVARRSLGASGPAWSHESLREEMRARRGVPALEVLGQDLRYSLRMMRRSPGFTAVALLSLAFGVGTNCAIFSVVDSLLLKSLPVEGADRLLVLAKSDGGQEIPFFSYPAYRQLQDSATVCSGVIAATPDFEAVVRPAAAAPAPPGKSAQPMPRTPPMPPTTPMPVTLPTSPGTGEAVETAAVELVSGNMFPLLAGAMAAGRAFTSEESATPGGQPVAVLGYGYWRRRFAGDPGAVGQVLRVNGLAVTVVGVSRRGFHGPVTDAAPDVFLPITLRDAVRYQGNVNSDGPEVAGRPVWEQENTHWLLLLAQRRPGIGVERATAVLSVLFRRDQEARLPIFTLAQDRRNLLAQRLVLRSGARGFSRLRQVLAEPLLVLLAVAGLVLAIACANVANLLLARADRRRKEIALRLSIGAGRGRLVRQLLTESLALAGLGGALGVACAGWGGRLLLMLVSRTGQPVPLDVDLDWRKLAFGLAVALATGCGCGLAPALQATRLNLATSLKEGAGALGAGGGPGPGAGSGRPGAGGGGSGRLGRALVAAQIAMSLLLLAGAGLFVRSLQNLVDVDTGFARGGLVLVSINPHLLGYDDARLAALYGRLVERLEAVPGVRSASFANLRMLSGSAWSENIALPGYLPRQDEDMDVQLRVVTRRYFETVGIRLVAGRTFTARDRQGAPQAVVINEAMARRFWPHRPAVGQRFGFGMPAHARDLEVIGVVRDTRSLRLGEPPSPIAYRPVEQEPTALRDLEVRVAAAPGPGAGTGALLGMGGTGARAGQAPTSRWLPPNLAAQIRRAIAEVEPDLPVFSVTTMDDQLALSLAHERAVARLTGFFALLALLLAAVGLYGVVSYAVARRTNEIGLRMALGAPRARVVALVLRETAPLIAIGIAAGLAAALALLRLAASQLYGLSAHDPATLAAAALAMVAVALAAALVPAQRAASTDPMSALRS